MSEQPVTVDQPPEEKMSFMDKAAGVFYEPSKVFGSLKSSGVKFADWFVPVLLLAVVGGVGAYVRFSTPDLRYQSMQIAEQSIDKMVSEGKMTADQAQVAKTQVEKGSSAITAIGIVGTFVGIFIIFFIASGVWLLVGKFALKGTMTYTDAMGIVGLTYWISLVGTIVGIVLSVAFSRLDGGLQLGMLTTMNMQSKSYLLMTKVDLFTLWGLFAISAGLATLTQKKVTQSAIWVFGLWAVWSLASALLLGGRFG